MRLKIDDRSLDIPALSPICTLCQHMILGKVRRCRAFRNADIPLDVWMGETPHGKPIEGDHGLQFLRAD